jgi:hypothetical protein
VVPPRLQAERGRSSPVFTNVSGVLVPGFPIESEKFLLLPLLGFLNSVHEDSDRELRCCGCCPYTGQEEKVCVSSVSSGDASWSWSSVWSSEEERNSRRASGAKLSQSTQEVLEGLPTSLEAFDGHPSHRLQGALEQALHDVTPVLVLGQAQDVVT